MSSFEIWLQAPQTGLTGELREAMASVSHAIWLLKRRGVYQVGQSSLVLRGLMAAYPDLANYPEALTTAEIGFYPYSQ